MRQTSKLPAAFKSATPPSEHPQTHALVRAATWVGESLNITQINVSVSIYKWKSYATRPKGRPKLRWEDDARNDLRKMGVKNWKQRAQERKQWK
jgi:hypothetical protein